MITVENLNFTYFGNKSPSLIDISLKIKDGMFVLITGPSDCGKSTLIRCLNGLIPHFYGGTISGRIEVNGIDPFSTSTKDMCDTIGMVFQNTDNQLIMNTVEEEITFGLENLGFRPEDIRLRLEQILNTLKISHLRNRSISTLSGGEKQKVALASILAMKPSILVLDEPTSELDPISANEFIECLIELKIQGHLTIIVVEHRLEKLIPHTDLWVIMNNNKIEEVGSPESLLKRRTDFFGINIPLSFRWYLKFKDSIPDLTIPMNKASIKTMIEQIQSQMKLNSEPKENTEIFAPDKMPINDSSRDSFSIVIDSLRVAYNSTTQVLKGINAKIRMGAFVSIIGRNGSGKTTLLKSIVGLKSPEKGAVYVNGKLVDPKNVSQNARTVAMIFQNPTIQFYLDTVYEELTVALKNFGLKIRNYEEKIENILDLFNLRPYSKRYPRYLSVGTQQKLALAAVLLWNPDIILLDEPTHGMDYKQKQSFFELINSIRKKGLTVVLVTHDMESVLRYSDYVYLLSDGNIKDEGVPEELFHRNLDFVPNFFSETGIQEYKRWII